jgi:hypothetical protein
VQSQFERDAELPCDAGTSHGMRDPAATLDAADGRALDPDRCSQLTLRQAAGFAATLDLSPIEPHL